MRAELSVPAIPTWALTTVVGPFSVQHSKSVAPAGSKSLRSKNASDIAKCHMMLDKGKILQWRTTTTRLAISFS